MPKAQGRQQLDELRQNWFSCLSKASQLRFLWDTLSDDGWMSCNFRVESRYHFMTTIMRLLVLSVTLDHMVELINHDRWVLRDPGLNPFVLLFFESCPLIVDIPEMVLPPTGPGDTAVLRMGSSSEKVAMKTIKRTRACGGRRLSFSLEHALEQQWKPSSMIHGHHMS